MKIKIIMSIIILTSLHCNSILASSEQESSSTTVDPFYLKHPFLCLSPQFGFDVGFTNIAFTQDQGHQMFAKQQFPITGYFNVSFNDKFGIEIGYTMPKRKRNDVMINGGDLIPGQSIATVPAGQFEKYNAFVELRQPYIGLKYDFHFNNRKPYLFWVIGVTSMKVRAQWEKIDGSLFDPEITPITTKRIFDFRKNIPFIKLGVYIPLTWWNEHLSIRLATTWFKTSLLQNSIMGYGPDDIATIKAKNTLHYSIGVAYSI